jgi:hypothetical protein
LRSFKDIDSGLRADLRSFFRDLADELLGGRAESVSDLAEVDPTERSAATGTPCASNWAALAPVVVPFDATFADL